jgi:centrosomal CEP192-like protein
LIRQPCPRLPIPRPVWTSILLLQTLLIFLALFISGCAFVGENRKADSPPTSPSPAPPSPTPPPSPAPPPTPVSAPSITTNPTSQTATAGQSAVFSVIAAGTAPLAYQWQKNGVTISGATSTAYATPPTRASDDGSIFVVVVSNAAGSLMSSPAMLSVVPGTAQLTADSSNLNFGNVIVGSGSTAIVTLTSSGTAPVTISAVSALPQGFSTSSSLAGLTIAPGQAATLSLTFAPPNIAAFSGAIIISSNAMNSQISIPVSGAGIAAPSHSVSLSWAPSTSSDVVGYFVLRGDQSGGPYTQLTSTPITALTYTDLAVHAGQTYFYVIVAADSAGQISAPSNEAAVTIPTP